ncbi:hypothetical protein [Streptomyces sp. NPDC020965]|uniref:bestrophin-like domain n=1 Tax=Streptomyces sp. NPDC020965 TaxID=3365105 RepID=UPI003790914F
MPASFVVIPAVGLLTVGGMVWPGRPLKARWGVRRGSDGPSVVEYVTAMIGVIYAVVLGLAVITVWDSLKEAEKTVSAEASALRDVFLLSAALDDPEAVSRVQTMAHTYAREVVAVEWPMMREGAGLDPAGWHQLDLMRSDLVAAKVETAKSTEIFGQALDSMQTVYESRRERDMQAGVRMPGLLWLGLVLGGVISVAVAILLAESFSRSHMLLTAVLAILIAFQLVLIYELDVPYGHGIRVSSAPFDRAIDRFDRLS